MNVLDENIDEHQRQILRKWRIHVVHIGQEVGHEGMTDQQIIPLLHQMQRPTFFTRDLGLYDRALCHGNYCLVCLAVVHYEAASFIRRFLRHPDFNTTSKRLGCVVQVSHSGIRALRLPSRREARLDWA
jgi:hypothetical protein